MLTLHRWCMGIGDGIFLLTETIFIAVLYAANRKFYQRNRMFTTDSRTVIAALEWTRRAKRIKKRKQRIAVRVRTKNVRRCPGGRYGKAKSVLLRFWKSQ